MDDLESKIKELLSNPEELAKLGALAASILGAQNKESGQGPDQAVSAFAPSDSGSGQAARPSIPPGLLGSAVSGAQANERPNTINSQKMGLIAAMKPFLSEDYRHQIDRGIRMVRTADMLNGLFKTLNRGE